MEPRLEYVFLSPFPAQQKLLHQPQLCIFKAC